MCPSFFHTFAYPMSLKPHIERDHYLVELGVFSYETFFLSTPSVGTESLVHGNMFLRTPTVGRMVDAAPMFSSMVRTLVLLDLNLKWLATKNTRRCILT